MLVATIGDAAGLRADRVIAFGMNEGAFPDRRALRTSLRSRNANDLRPSLAFAREMCRFISLAGIAERSITFTYANSDIKGRRLLKASFVDELERLLAGTGSKAKGAPLVREARPTSVPPAELAVAPLFAACAR